MTAPQPRGGGWAGPALVAWLTLVWLLLWGFSFGNLLAGVALGTILVVVVPRGAARGGGVRPVAVVRFGWHFARALVVSTASVAATVLRPRLRLEEGIVVVPLRARSPVVVAFVANAVTLTPGTLTVDVRPRSYGIEQHEGEVSRDGPTAVDEGPVLFVHCLVTGDPDAVRVDVSDLERLAIDAFGTPEDRRAVASPPPPWPPMEEPSIEKPSIEKPSIEEPTRRDPR